MRKTIRLLYPDYMSGGLETYYFGAQLMRHILPPNDEQKLVRVEIAPPDGKERPETEGIVGLDDVLAGIRDAKRKLAEEKPERVVTIGGNCVVSLAPFDYLRGVYGDVGIVWIDAHPDVSTPEDGYPRAHAMVLGSLLGGGAPAMRRELTNPPFESDRLLYVGLQPLHDYQTNFLKKAGVKFKIQDRAFVSNDEIASFARRFDRLLVHLDVDVLDEHFFHSTYFANPELKGDGSGGGKMKTDKLTEILRLVEDSSDVVGLTIAEYLPFDEERLRKMFGSLKLFAE